MFGGHVQFLNRKRSDSRFWLSLLLACLVLAGCGQQSGRRLTVTGSSTMAPLLAEIGRRFEQLHPQVRVDVQTGGSGQGISDVRQRVADLGMASRKLTAEETDLTAYPIAADGVCLIVHESNPLTELSDQQVLDIYLDRVNNWQQLGGSDCEITVVHKAEGRATLEVFLHYFQMRNPEIRADVIVGDNEHGIKSVVAAKGAIGYVSIGTAEAEQQAGVPIRLLPMAGVPPTTENVRSGAFPVYRPLNLVVGADPDPWVLKLIRYCQSEDVHDLVVAQHFVPFSE